MALQESNELVYKITDGIRAIKELRKSSINVLEEKIEV